jgi:DNA-binding transcriptional LysR family regulator
MALNYELYKVFYQVASDLSFSKAAEKLFISQSAVSQNIKNLEKELKTELFIRSTKKVRLTEAGKILFEHIEPAFNLIESGEKSIREINSLERGEIHIGFTQKYRFRLQIEPPAPVLTSCSRTKLI